LLKQGAEQMSEKKLVNSGGKPYVVKDYGGTLTVHRDTAIIHQ